MHQEVESHLLKVISQAKPLMLLRYQFEEHFELREDNLGRPIEPSLESEFCWSVHLNISQVKRTMHSFAFHSP